MTLHKKVEKVALEDRIANLIREDVTSPGWDNLSESEIKARYRKLAFYILKLVAVETIT